MPDGACPGGMFDGIVMNSPSYDDVLLLPPSGRQASADASSRRAGAYDASGRLISPSLLLRRDKPVKLFALEAHAEAGCDREVILGGHWFGGFGHFLLETLSRAWFFRHRPELTICWLAQDERIAGWQRELLDLLGVANPIRIVSRPLRVGRLLLPEPGFQIGRYFRERQVETLAVVPPRAPLPSKRVWLSRSALPDGIVLDEPEIERRLGDDWIIYHPETHPIREQLAMLADAERIAGFIGSACHAFVLFRALGARIDLFSRSPTVNENYAIIAETKGLDQHIHTPAVIHLGGRGNAANHRLEDGGFPVRLLQAATPR